jgi:hypothetical protein
MITQEQVEAALDRLWMTARRATVLVPGVG